jgi:hypothetical protein
MPDFDRGGGSVAMSGVLIWHFLSGDAAAVEY